MNKSRLIILLSLLTMLLPFAGDTFFSKAMGFEKYYDTEQYMDYAMDMVDGYGEEYQSPPQAYTNDNNYYEQSLYGDFVKKIKCNNVNSNLNGIDSTVGVNSPLGGVGDEEVSANAYGNGDERNSNGYFDVDCINTNNNDNTVITQSGIPGPRGPVGPEGPQGEPGPSQILPENLYKVVGEEATSAFSFAESQATCDEGDLAISGGINTRSFDGPVLGFYNGPEAGTIPPPPEYNDDAWVANILGNNVVVVAYAICFDNPPDHMS